VRSVTIGVWLSRGSRHESDVESGIAHFVEHMLFKGTATRSAQAIAEEVDSIGGQLDAFTAKEYAAYYIRVLDEHLPIAVNILSDMILNPALTAVDVAKEQSVILEEIKMVEDAPDDLVHEVFTRQFWLNHPLGRPILGTPETVNSFSSQSIRDYFSRTYTAPNLIVAAAGNFQQEALRDLVSNAFAKLPTTAPSYPTSAPAVGSGLSFRKKDIEQSHICLGTGALSQGHDDRHVAYVLNTILGGSMSSRLFQHIREERGLAYSVFRKRTSYRDPGTPTGPAGFASLEGLADAEPREHVQPHVTSGATGVVLHASLLDGRNAREHREGHGRRYSARRPGHGAWRPTERNNCGSRSRVG